MKDIPDKKRNDYALVQLIPNMMTIAAICAGLSAIRFGVQGEYTLAVKLIIAASVLDGLDGRLARMLRSDSKMGAELDSFADFLNFGVAPPLILYFWALQDTRNGAWISVLIYVVCSVMRLARFNIKGKADHENGEAAPSAYFTGVPSPAAALLVMLPMFISFAFDNPAMLPGWVISANMVVVGLAMISRIPTWSFKTTRISRENVKFFMLGFVLVGAALLTYAWITLVVLCVGYIGMVIWGFFVKAS
jgi:CDP-diacylglycerol--serine O-phosphatidyltransferase